MNHYAIYTLWENSSIDSRIFTNKLTAIKEARIAALNAKKSMIVVNNDTDIAIAIAEFPYIFRDMKLDVSDIGINMID